MWDDNFQSVRYKTPSPSHSIRVTLSLRIYDVATFFGFVLRDRFSCRQFATAVTMRLSLRDFKRAAAVESLLFREPTPEPLNSKCRF